MSDQHSMLIALQSLEDVYVRGRTVHLVGNGHRFYGNIECESAAGLDLGEVEGAVSGLLGEVPEWELRLEIRADTDMGRSGCERITLRFAKKDHALAVRAAFLEVAARLAAR